MARILGLPALLVVALVVAYLFAQELRSNGPTSASGRQEISQARSAAAATNLSQAEAAVQAFYAQSGTYAGATLPPGSGVVLVRADATSYCLESGTEHEHGPGGQPQPGGC